MNESADQWSVRASLFSMEVVVISEHKYVDITAAKKMCSVSVSHSKVLRFFWQYTDIGSMVYSTGQGMFVMDVHVKHIFDTKNTCLGAC